MEHCLGYAGYAAAGDVLARLRPFKQFVEFQRQSFHRDNKIPEQSLRSASSYFRNGDRDTDKQLEFLRDVVALREKFLSRPYGALPSTFGTVAATLTSNWSFYGTLSSSPTPILKYVQGAYATPQTSQLTVPVTYPAAQTSGNLNVVIVGWNDAVNSVSSVTDSKGNPYQRATGPVMFNSLSQSIYYAKNIAGGSNTVTVNFSGAATYPDIRVLEYSGISTSNPFDVAAGSGGTGTLSSSGAVTTSSASDLLVAGNVVANQTNGPVTGFAQKILTVPDSDIVEDEIVNSLASYTATAPLSSGDWVMQIVAFRAATQPK
jgi:hypothetical protein